MSESSIWTEKYRPQKFEDIKGQKKIVEKYMGFQRKTIYPFKRL